MQEPDVFGIGAFVPERAVHGKYVPGLPWDNLPKPKVEAHGDPTPKELDAEFQELMRQYIVSLDNVELYRDDFERAERESRRLSESIEQLITDVRPFDAEKADEMKAIFYRA